MEESSFFNDVDGDRVYYAEDFAEYFIPFFTNGIFNNGCQVLGNTNDMAVNIGTGRAFIEGHRYRNKQLKTLAIDNADGVLNRIDNIVIRLDLTNRNITTQVIKGAFSNNPVAPNLTRTSTIYDLRIAKVYIPAGTTEITQDLIEDCRFITSDCGNVISPIETPDTEQLFIQIQAIFAKFISDNTNEFDTWFEHVKGQLSTDQAGNLQNQIDDITNVTDGLQNQINDVNSTTSNLQHLVNQKTSIHLLWTNPNPDSMVKNTEIELADDDYDFLLIFYDHTSSAFENGTLTPKGKNAMLFAIGLSSGQTARRNLTYIDDTHYQSSVPYVASSENSAACVPYQIYGIKFE